MVIHKQVKERKGILNLLPVIESQGTDYLIGNLPVGENLLKDL